MLTGGPAMPPTDEVPGVGDGLVCCTPGCVE